MQAKISVEIDRAVRLVRFWHGDRRPQIVVFALAIWHKHIQAINRTSLENSDQHFFLAIALYSGLRCGKLVQKIRRHSHQAKARQSDPARFQKISSIHKCLPLAKSSATRLDASASEMVIFLFFAIAYR